MNQATYAVHERPIFDSKRSVWVCKVWGHDAHSMATCEHANKDIAESNARRVAECLNACDGMVEPAVQVAAAVVLAGETQRLRDRVSMKNFTTEEVAAMSKDSLEAELSNRVYAAAVFLEKMEYVGRIRGNGHHKAQRVAAAAVQEMNDAWKG